VVFVLSQRSPRAAGLFYLGYEEGLTRDVKKYLGDPPKDGLLNAKGVVVPHAGYEYSGPVAGSVYASIKIPKRVVILGPNHTGFGHEISADDESIWRTPLGDARVDLEMTKMIVDANQNIRVSRDAHRLEHSIEVQLPFLQVLTDNNFRFTPIAMKGNADVSVFESLGKTIAGVISDLGEDVLVVASSDFTHYEPKSYAEKMDALVIDQILELDPRKMLRVVYENDVTMCGYGPVATMLFAALESGATKAKKIKYSTSADFSMDEASVVGYGGLAIY